MPGRCMCSTSGLHILAGNVKHRQTHHSLHHFLCMCGSKCTRACECECRHKYTTMCMWGPRTASCVSLGDRVKPLPMLGQLAYEPLGILQAPPSILRCKLWNYSFVSVSCLWWVLGGSNLNPHACNGKCFIGWAILPAFISKFKNQIKIK